MTAALSSVQVLMFMTMRLDEMFMSGRMILSGSGYINRVGALLKAVDASKYDMLGAGDESSQVIRFEGVTVDTPTGTRLVNGLSFESATGGADNILVVGENGVGKTSIFRTLAGLWPQSGEGSIQRPGSMDIIFLPQSACTNGRNLPLLVSCTCLHAAQV